MPCEEPIHPLWLSCLEKAYEWFGLIYMNTFNKLFIDIRKLYEFMIQVYLPCMSLLKLASLTTMIQCDAQNC